MATPRPEKKLFLLDAYALIYRAHFAFSRTPRINSKGQSTGAALGFTNSLVEVLQKEKPTHIGIAFDTPTKTFRHTEFEAYKAQRQKQPEDITAMTPYICRIIEAMHIPILKVDGFEADDVIGTLAWKAGDAGFEVFMMTPDKDYCQLVRDHVYLYKPAYMGNAIDILDVKKVLEKWEIERVDQVTDILGLQGDAVDNIPGIPGIGEKTAKSLIKQYGSVENLVAHAHELKGKQRENVENFGVQGILSKRLATIHTEVPIEFNPDRLIMEEPDAEKLREVFEELEFRTLAQRILGDSTTSARTTPARKGASIGNSQGDLFALPPETILPAPEEPGTRVKASLETTPHFYHLMDTPELRQSLIGFLEKQTELSWDTETTGIDPITAELVGFSFCYREAEAYYVPFPEDQKAAKKLVEEFRGVLENPAIRKIGQNIKYDLVVLKKYGVEVVNVYDTMLAHYLLEPEYKHNMDYLAEAYLHYLTIPIEALIGKGKAQKNMRDLAPEAIVDYACEDADITLRLKHYFDPLLRKQGLDKLMDQVENPLVPVLGAMEAEGVSIDTGALGDISKALTAAAIEAETDIFRLAGQEFNIGSPKQLGEVLFDKLELGGKTIKKTKTGQYATGEEILSQLSGEHEIAQRILDYRQLVKLKNTYVDALPQMVCPLDNRVHTSYNQAVAATGRLSSTNPNLQNIPIRTDQGKEIRKAFVPRDKHHTILSADYSQIELRIMASFSKDPTMVEAFKTGQDIHASTASKVFHVPLNEVDSDMRRKSKMINFGIIYGISAFGLAQRLKIPRKEASGIIQAYFEEFPSVKGYMDSVVERARELEYAETLLGRRRYLRDINSRNATVRQFAERNAINAPIQGTAADMIKVAMLNIHEWLREEKLRTRMILQVHDELVFDAHKEEVEYITPKIIELMSTALPLEVPIEVGTGTGSNWLEAH